MYRLGERLGVDSLCGAFDMVGLGRSTGLGLREERYGINPTPGWLARNKNAAVRPAHGRLFAIGQGEVSVTPVQAANLMATYADGRYRQLTLIRSQQDRPQWKLPASEAHWRAIRQAIFDVTNHTDGTAHKHAFFHRDGWALAGKTGSATAHPWPTAYRVPFIDTDGTPGEAIIPAGARGPALECFARENPAATVNPADVTVHSRWPTESPAGEGVHHAHAWFAGYLQRVDGAGQPLLEQTPPVAFAVLVEFGGSGGRTTGPIARRIAQTLIDVLGPDLAVEPL
jgi:cell division protein FtsI/penicillin-binding protein 2